MALDQQLLEILACPDTHHAPLDYDAEAQTLTCTECGRIFPIRDDIPILLLDEALPPAQEPASDGARPESAAEPVSADAEPEPPAAPVSEEPRSKPAGEQRTSAGPLAATSVEKPVDGSAN